MPCSKCLLLLLATALSPLPASDSFAEDFCVSEPAGAGFELVLHGVENSTSTPTDVALHVEVKNKLQCPVAQIYPSEADEFGIEILRTDSSGDETAVVCPLPMRLEVERAEHDAKRGPDKHGYSPFRDTSFYPNTWYGVAYAVDRMTTDTLHAAAIRNDVRRYSKGIAEAPEWLLEGLLEKETYKGNQERFTLYSSSRMTTLKLADYWKIERAGKYRLRAFLMVYPQSNWNDLFTDMTKCERAYSDPIAITVGQDGKVAMDSEVRKP